MFCKLLLHLKYVDFFVCLFICILKFLFLFYSLWSFVLSFVIYQLDENKRIRLCPSSATIPESTVLNTKNIYKTLKAWRPKSHKASKRELRKMCIKRGPKIIMQTDILSRLHLPRAIEELNTTDGQQIWSVL